MFDKNFCAILAKLPLYHKWYKCTIYGTVLKRAWRRRAWSMNDGCARKWRANTHISPVDSARVAQNITDPLETALIELETQISLSRSRDILMPARALVVGDTVRGKTRQVLNKHGNIVAIEGRHFFVL